MGPIGIDLKSLLEQDRQLALDVLETSQKLVLELQAAHYWTVHSLDVFNSLRNIGANLKKLIGVAQPFFGEGARLFQTAEGAKLWNTALGLWQALPPVRNKFSEQLARRRRERIMGQAVLDLDELEPGQVQADNDRYQAALVELAGLFAELLPLINGVPAGLVPEEPKPAAAAAANGQLVEPKPAARINEIAAPLPGAAQSGVSAQDAGGAPPADLPADDLSPV